MITFCVVAILITLIAGLFGYAWGWDHGSSASYHVCKSFYVKKLDELKAQSRKKQDAIRDILNDPD